jgi:hypothetical protein
MRVSDIKFAKDPSPAAVQVKTETTEREFSQQITRFETKPPEPNKKNGETDEEEQEMDRNIMEEIELSLRSGGPAYDHRLDSHPPGALFDKFAPKPSDEAKSEEVVEELVEQDLKPKKAPMKDSDEFEKPIEENKQAPEQQREKLPCQEDLSETLVSAYEVKLHLIILIISRMRMVCQSFWT